ncbi:uncharacterized protein LOC131253556 [Magnolia sinica]|uniref:uncharacterized protein LOC131253556 n=1 Tax=Magnolia sinica TaxID=86752 RepID=UPI002657EAD8|nr:uncharacterized protein LOC131253556 [Magnolia sinica]
MPPTSSDLPPKSLQIKQDDKFYGRLLSKESSIANPSFRVYYGVASGAIPFMWESQPGTPKCSIPTTTLPPLTPPPSYHFKPKKKTTKKGNGSNLLGTILPRLTLRKAHVSPSSSSSSSSSSFSSSSSPWSPSLSSNSRGRSPRSSFSLMEDDEDQEVGSPNSPFCFSIGREGGGPRGCYSMVIMKNALLSIVGHGSSQGTTA